MTSDQRQSVQVSFSDGCQYRWPVPDGASVADTFEEIRQTIAGGQWFVIPETGKSYSPHAIVSLEIVTRSTDDDPSAAERFGQKLREHVIDPINESG